MSSQELIQAEIEHIPDEKLDDLYRLIQGFQEAQSVTRPPSILAKLRAIKISGPPDLAANLNR